MTLQLTGRNLFAFFLFGCLMGEAHEIAHFIAGKAFCGCWPAWRDFNAWGICPCDMSFLATAAGPLFSFAVAWTGMFMLKSHNPSIQSLGFISIWGSVPQARVATILGGGGDELVVARIVTAGTPMEAYYKLIAMIIVFALALPPMIAAFRAVSNKWGWLINIGFSVGALAVWALYLFGLMNNILASGFLAEVWIMGTPLLITLHTIMVLLLLLFVRRELFTFVKTERVTQMSAA